MSAPARLTVADALVRHLAAQWVEIGGVRHRLFGGVWAIFGHGNVAGLGHALEAAQDELPTRRAHNEQAMAHAAAAYAKAWRRKRMMACTTSIGPGATNLVTAAAGAHVNRLPLLLLPGDVFAGRGPDPVLQQLEDPTAPEVTVNDCLRPVSRYFDRIQRPEQLLSSLPSALAVLTDPARCGPVTLALPQDVQTEAYDWPAGFFAPRTWRARRPAPDPEELAAAVAALGAARRPLVVVGGGALYADAEGPLGDWAAQAGLPVATTQAGHGALAWSHPSCVGGVGVTGTAAANTLAEEADLVLAVGTRLSDFTTASRTLFAGRPLVQLNVSAPDAGKHGARPLVADARAGIEALRAALPGWGAEPSWVARAAALKADWDAAVDALAAPKADVASDAEVLLAVHAVAGPNATVVCAAGGLPGELHRLWRPAGPGHYHLEYGYSCMGYEIAGGLGVKMACPEREIFVLVGDGSYLMMNSEIATSVAAGYKLVVVVLDNRGFGCIHRLQAATGGAPFTNLREGAPDVDFAAHAAALGAAARAVEGPAGLPEALAWARAQDRTAVVTVRTDPARATAIGGAWWDVAVPEASARPEARAARRAYEAAIARRREGEG